jgi:hypothetical protein
MAEYVEIKLERTSNEYELHIVNTNSETQRVLEEEIARLQGDEFQPRN